MARDRSREMVRSLAPIREPANGLSIEELASIMALMRANDIEEINIEREADAHAAALMLRLRRPASDAVVHQVLTQPAAVAEPDGNGEAEPATDTLHAVVKAQLVGTFHVGSQPGQRAAFKGEEHVTQGQILGTIETLGSFIEVESPVAGKIVASHVAEGDTVEFGQRLLTIEPDAPDPSDEPAEYEV